MLTEQTIFNKVYRHLLRQNQPSLKEGSIQCVYRGKNNTRCAVGCLITNKEYRPEMEGKNINTLSQSILLPARLKPFINLLSNLQSIHDYHPVKSWKQSLEELAARAKLSVPKL